jgi:hypothetical protein
MHWAHRLYFGLVGHGEGAGESRGGGGWGRRIISRERERDKIKRDLDIAHKLPELRRYVFTQQT